MARTPRVYKFTIGFFFLATCIYFIVVHKVITAKKARMLLSAIQYTKPQTIFPTHRKTLSLCPEATANTEYAFVAMLSHDFHLYGPAAVKLGHTLHRHSNLDMIMLELITKPIPQDTRMTLRRAGWTTCKVSKIPGPSHVANDANRFLHAYIYSKFHAWQLIEYSAIALLDLDMLATKDPSDLFTAQLPLMLHANNTIGAVRDHPFQECYGMGPWNTFNAGLLLIAPSTHTYTVLVNSIDRIQHNSAFDAEQALINTFFKDAIFELPVRYNANTVIKVCEPVLWLEHHHDFRLVHYTVSKPWTYSMKWTNLQDPFACWFWHVEDYCMLWDMINVHTGI